MIVVIGLVIVLLLLRVINVQSSTGSAAGSTMTADPAVDISPAAALRGTSSNSSMASGPVDSGHASELTGAEGGTAATWRENTNTPPPPERHEQMMRFSSGGVYGFSAIAENGTPPLFNNCQPHHICSSPLGVGDVYLYFPEPGPHRRGQLPLDLVLCPWALTLLLPV